MLYSKMHIVLQHCHRCINQIQNEYLIYVYLDIFWFMYFTRTILTLNECHLRFLCYYILFYYIATSKYCCSRNVLLEFYRILYINVNNVDNCKGTNKPDNGIYFYFALNIDIQTIHIHHMHDSYNKITLSTFLARYIEELMIQYLLRL